MLQPALPPGTCRRVPVIPTAWLGLRMMYAIAIMAAVLYSVASARLYIALGSGNQVALRDPVLEPVPLQAPAGMAGVPASSVPLSERRAGEQAMLVRRRRITLALAALAALLHAFVSLHQTHLPGDFVLPFFTAFGLTALGIVVLQLLLCLRQPADYLGLAVYPLAAIALIASQAAGGTSPVLDASIQIHVLLSILAYALLALAAAQAILVAVQRHFLMAHRPGGFMRALPPFDTMESLLFTLLTAGFGMLTLALISGFIYLDDMFAQHLVHKTVLSSLAWLMFGILLAGRWRWGWRGRRAVHWTLAGFAVLILAYFGSKLVVELILHRT